jgi:2-C-methyl-D-erythritol 2,4-cyclodiphosphate synthase
MINVRVGLGYDVHRLVKGRPLILGGVKLESAVGLDGHSDADVLCHAIGDALLGALGLGDLGTHFPPGDKKWKDASSLELLRLIRAMLDGRNASVVNVDAAVVCEAPSWHRHATR